MDWVRKEVDNKTNRSVKEYWVDWMSEGLKEKQVASLMSTER